MEPRPAIRSELEARIGKGYLIAAKPETAAKRTVFFLGGHTKLISKSLKLVNDYFKFAYQNPVKVDADFYKRPRGKLSSGSGEVCGQRIYD